MKAILISIKPKYVAKILNGEKTIEIRKTMPKCDLPIDVYIYCTKEKERLVKHRLANGGISYTLGKEFSYYDDDLNGKVVAKFTLKEIRLAKYQPYVDEASKMANKLTCLTDDELDKYLNKKDGYGWVIDNLEIFDEPKELSEFKRCTEKACIYGKCHKYMHCLKPLTKAPQSFMFIEVE